MALVSDKPKFIFFHLYKCAGMSLRKSINENVANCYELQGGHGLPSDLKTHFEKNESLEKFNEYFKFTFIRNPFDFIVDTYFYARNFTNHFMHDTIMQKNMDIEAFIPYYMNERILHQDESVRPFGSNKVVTIKDWLHDSEGNEIMDFIGKVETLDADMATIYEKLGLPKLDVPKVNMNPNRSSNYREYYSPKAKEMIEKHFSWELEKFGYEF